jgi:hypothetical protein
MSDTEEKALALVNFERGRLQQPLLKYPPAGEVFIVLCRVMEQHEAYKEEYSDFRQEVSKIASSALVMYNRVGEGNCLTAQALQGIIIPAPKPDRLASLFVTTFKGSDIGEAGGYWWIEKKFRAALEALGLEIREKGK